MKNKAWLVSILNRDGTLLYEARLQANNAQEAILESLDSFFGGWPFWWRSYATDPLFVRGAKA